VRARCPGSKLLLVGSGPAEPTLRRLCRDLGLEQHCHFEPRTVDVAGWMRSMDIFVLSSESESFPNALLEAMACGCAVAAAKVGGVPEMVTDGQDGLLFEPRNASDLAAKMLRLIECSDLRRALGAQAARTARERFPVERAVERMERLYTSLLQGSPPRT
jgi:glycosyltransferase involved in cell wall biosynthesis